MFPSNNISNTGWKNVQKGSPKNCSQFHWSGLWHKINRSRHHFLIWQVFHAVVDQNERFDFFLGQNRYFQFMLHNEQLANHKKVSFVQSIPMHCFFKIDKIRINNPWKKLPSWFVTSIRAIFYFSEGLHEIKIIFTLLLIFPQSFQTWMTLQWWHSWFNLFRRVGNCPVE